MKYCVHGFFQPRAVELGLTNDDLLVLRWLVDFANTKKMNFLTVEGKIYYRVDYDAVLKDLPVLKISKQTLLRLRFGNLCRAQVLVRHQVKACGTTSYYCYGINYDTLQYLTDDDDKCKEIHTGVKNYTSEVNKNTSAKCSEIHLINNNTNPNIKNHSLVQNGQDASAFNLDKATESEIILVCWKTFYKKYPRKENKKEAEAAYIKSFKGLSKEEIIEHAKVILAGLTSAIENWEQQEIEKRYIPLPAKWISGERWNNIE